MLGLISKFKIYLIVGGIVLTLFGSLTKYTLHLKGQNAVLMEQIDRSEEEKARLRKDLEDLDKLYAERNALTSDIEKKTALKLRNLEELKVNDEEVKEYLDSTVPKPIVDSLQQW